MTQPARILFVDDEPRLLEAIENMLFDRLDQWELVFARSGGEAIVSLEGRADIDVVVTDMRMPGVDGVDVLRYAASQRPQVMRVVLSGHAEAIRSMQAVALGHQYLLKPCEETSLVTTLERALHIRDCISDGQLRATVGALDCTPPSSAALEELRPLLRSRRASLNAITAAINRDVGLATKLMQIANSAIYTGARVSSVATAVQRIGLDGVGALATALAMYERFRVQDTAMLEHANAHATRVAGVAAALCSQAEDVELAFLAGLLHGLGMAAFATHAAPRLRRAHATIAPGESMTAGERREFGIDHAHLGAELLELWRMTDLANLVRYHHTPSQVPGAAERISVLAALHLADAAAEGGEAELDPIFMEALGPKGPTAWRRARNLAGGNA